MNYVMHGITDEGEVGIFLLRTMEDNVIIGISIEKGLDIEIIINKNDFLNNITNIINSFNQDHLYGQDTIAEPG